MVAPLDDDEDDADDVDMVVPPVVVFNTDVVS